MVQAYRLVPSTAARDAARVALPGAAAVAFPSSSAARHFCALFDDAPAALAAAQVAAMGEETARTLRELGVRVDVLPEKPGADGLVQALAQRLAR